MMNLTLMAEVSLLGGALYYWSRMSPEERRRMAISSARNRRRRGPFEGSRSYFYWAERRIKNHMRRNKRRDRHGERGYVFARDLLRRWREEFSWVRVKT